MAVLIKSLQGRFRREKRKALTLSHSREQMLQDGRWPKGMWYYTIMSSYPQCCMFVGGLGQLRRMLIAFEPRAQQLIDSARHGRTSLHLERVHAKMSVTQITCLHMHIHILF